MTTIGAARDIVSELFLEEWQDDEISADVAVLWDNVGKEKPEQEANGVAAPWVRVSVRHTGGEQDTLGPRGQRRFAQSAIFTVQIFTPIGDGHTLGDQLVEIAKRATRRRPSPEVLWFFRTRVEEIGIDGPWFNTNVVADLTYREAD